ncbi:nicotinate phosphoribosyltransferase [Microbispora sp. RL4-1S]|uniref:Nicotinate phosphoribosyltransferase n=1 Tax=Microbispora oryzae TaxID=2806554 RepID=A0A941AJ80_9ACTN|nr:nicotinate phosphoribosyltransferase [Microbispora oryzae]MBP2703918.1 nicotinate phosphoribosyltransferase [Microbispora oryzae]
MTGGLVTDLYELNMAASYLRRGMTDAATFSLFVRRPPANRGFLVAAGLDDCLSYLESFRFGAAELDYLGRHLGYDRDLLRALERLRFTGDVWALPEGRVALPGEPIIEVTAPIAEAQLVETVLLNHVTFQTTVATKAVRCVLAAGKARVVDFSMRRTHGIEAAMTVARVSAIAGFAATSNVEAARRYGLSAVGTMAHSYVEAFEDDEAAFAAFAADLPAIARARPGRATFLVDTYDTVAGVRAAVAVARRMGLGDRVGVRLDSGDLLELSLAARRILDESGMPGAEILASGGLDEFSIADLVDARAPIDAYAVGTRMGVSADAPYLDSAYKLVAYGDRPVMKLSTGKVTLPGAKQVFRGPGGDVIGLRDEPPPPGCRPLLIEVMTGGRRAGPPEDLGVTRARCAADVAGLPEAARALRAPVGPPVRHSEALDRLTAEVGARLRAGSVRRRPWSG